MFNYSELVHGEVLGLHQQRGLAIRHCRLLSVTQEWGLLLRRTTALLRLRCATLVVEKGLLGAFILVLLFY